MHLTQITINPIEYERRIINQAYTGIAGNFRVQVIALGRKGQLKEESAPFGDIYRIISPFARGGPFKFIHFNFQLIFLLWRKQTDIIHAHDLWVLPAAAFVAALKNIKLIYDAHEYYAGLEIFNRHPFRRRLWLITESFCVKFVTILLTVSEPLAEKYWLRYPRIPDCRVIRNLPVREVPAKEKAAPFPRPFKHMLVYHGHLKPGRGLENLIQSMVYVEHTGLVIIGGGELLRKIEKFIDRLKIRKKVFILDYISLEKLISTSAQADIGIALFEKTSINYSYALPNKFFEYIMAGLPVLTSNIDTLTDYVKKYDLGRTVDPSDPVRIAEAIREMTDNPQSLKKWRNNALAAAKILNWDIESVKMLKIYEELAH